MIRQYKVTTLPASPTSADDGIYYVKGVGSTIQQIAVISGGVIHSYTGALASWERETHTDNVNPITSITLNYTPIVNSEEVFYNGVFCNKGVDYTISGDTITILFPTTTSDTFIVKYQY